MKSVLKIILLCLMPLAIVSCIDEEEKLVGNISLNFKFKIDDADLVRDSLMCENLAGNKYMVNDLQMIVSRLSLERSDGSELLLDDVVHYVDFVDTNTLIWTIDSIPNGVYNSIGFTFGLDSTLNKSGLFKNPPESDMFWPEQLGGGYHYMKLNCKWLYKNILMPLNFHLGVGREVLPFASNDIFIDNSFPVVFEIPFEVSSNYDYNFDVIMNVNSWFGPESIIDFEKIMDIAIMESQAIQLQAKTNGKSVFSIRKSDKQL